MHILRECNSNGKGFCFIKEKKGKTYRHRKKNETVGIKGSFYRRSESEVTSKAKPKERRKKNESTFASATRDSVHLLAHETEASRILPTERNQLHPASRPWGIHVCISLTVFYTRRATSLMQSQKYQQQESRTSKIFFSFFSFSLLLFFTLPSQTEIGSVWQWRVRSTLHFWSCEMTRRVELLCIAAYIQVDSFLKKKRWKKKDDLPYFSIDLNLDPKSNHRRYTGLMR